AAPLWPARRPATIAVADSGGSWFRRSRSCPFGTGANLWTDICRDRAQRIGYLSFSSRSCASCQILERFTTSHHDESVHRRRDGGLCTRSSGDHTDRDRIRTSRRGCPCASSSCHVNRIDLPVASPGCRPCVIIHRDPRSG